MQAVLCTVVDMVATLEQQVRLNRDVLQADEGERHQGCGLPNIPYQADVHGANMSIQSDVCQVTRIGRACVWPGRDDRVKAE